MQMTSVYKVLGLTASALLLSACASKGDVNEGAGETYTQQDGIYEEDARAVNGTGVNGQDLQAQAQAALLEYTVFYFEFDQSTLKEEGKDALKAHAAFLASNPSARVVLEGHADERGTVEYNLALGERRAMTVRRFLMANGAASNQLQVVSYGEERPAVVASNESAYSKNRRVEVKYQSR